MHSIEKRYVFDLQKSQHVNVYIVDVIVIHYKHNWADKIIIYMNVC